MSNDALEELIKRIRDARILACGAWSDVMEGGNVSESKCSTAQAAEDNLCDAIAALADFAREQAQSAGSVDAERARCIQDGEKVAACDAYFDARPQIDNTDRRRVFEAGFDRGYQRAESALQQLADQAQELGMGYEKSAPAVDPQLECNACDWKGPLSEACMLGSIGPLCPECRETTESVDACDCPPQDWRTPTTFIKRFGDAMQLLCFGHRPDDAMLLAWIEEGSEDIALQEFAANYGPHWAQGIGLIDAAIVCANQPTEGVDHEFQRAESAKPPAPVAEKACPDCYGSRESGFKRGVPCVTCKGSGYIIEQSSEKEES